MGGLQHARPVPIWLRTCPLEATQGGMEIGAHCSNTERGNSRGQHTKGQGEASQSFVYCCYFFSWGLGELQGEKGLRNHCQDEKMLQGGESCAAPCHQQCACDPRGRDKPQKTLLSLGSPVGYTTLKACGQPRSPGVTSGSHLWCDTPVPLICTALDCMCCGTG